MSIAYLNGEFLPFAEARIPVYDLGIVQGATVVERLRTVHHQPALLKDHLDRLRQSLSLSGWSLPEPIGPIEEVVHEVSRRNCEDIPLGSDLAIVLFVTAGIAIGDANGLETQSRPTVCVHTAPLPFEKWARMHQDGVQLVVPSTRQPPANVLNPHVKTRSRLHWTIADREARSQNPQAMALLLDQDGFVTETGSGNLFIVRDGKLCTPREETTLKGISQATVTRLATTRGWTVSREDLTIDDVATADEAFLTSSTFCILPVASIDGRRIGRQLPGTVTKMLSDVWSQEMGLDFVRQSFECAESASGPSADR